MQKLVICVAAFSIFGAGFLKVEGRHAPREDPPIFSGFIELEGKSYFFDSREFSWYEAMELCRSMDMNSLALETQEEEEMISNWFANNTEYTAMPIWTAANRKAFDSRWFWGTTGADVTEFNWAENYPQLDTAEHACIYFTVPKRGWFDLLCEVPESSYPGMICE